MTVRFLSDEWARAVKNGLSASDEFRAAAKGTRARVQQLIQRDDEQLSYWLEVDDGAVDVGTGMIPDASIVVTTDYATAVEMAKGELSAMAAFMSGRVQISNIMTAMGLQGALGAVGAVIKAIDTEY